MATALDRVAIAWFGQLSVRPQRALRVKAPEDTRVNALRVRIGFDPDEHVLAAADDADARRRFEALADGGQVQMPLAKTFFASSFGVVADRFGVSWMIVTEKA